MPQVLDAIPNGERQSAPRDYNEWEELCFRAAQHSLERGRRIPFWEVWNEVNAGWLKPGPNDTGGEPYKTLYTEALGTMIKGDPALRDRASGNRGPHYAEEPDTGNWGSS